MFIIEIFNLRIIGRATEPTNVLKLNKNENINTIIKLPYINNL